MTMRPRCGFCDKPDPYGSCEALHRMNADREQDQQERKRRMNLKEFHITPCSEYGKDKGKFSAKLCVAGDHAWDPTISITLEPEQLEPILGIVHALVVKNLDESVTTFREKVLASYGDKPLEIEATPATDAEPEAVAAE